MAYKLWNKVDKDKKLSKLKIPKKRKSKESCTPEELEMIYGKPDWSDLKSKQGK